MKDLDAEQISYIMFHKLSEDEREFLSNNFSFNQAILLVGYKEYRDEAIASYLNYIQFLEKLDRLHNHTVSEQDAITH